jgi:CHAT domain-containing protein/tetratricopeptide (TPR) repeat protein
MRIKIYLLAVIITTAASGIRSQSPLELLGDKALQAAGAKGTQLMQALDSVDFQFAVSVNENAGFFDIEQKGETRAQLLYQQKAQKEKTIIDIARDTLEQGVELYGIRRYEKAEQRFLGAKKLLEKRGLTGEIIYLRTLSNLGLVYLTQGRTLESERTITQSLTMSDKAMGKTSAAYVANLNNMAKLHQTTGKYNEAEKEWNEAIVLCPKVFGEGKAKGILLNNKAMLFLTVGRYKEAANLMNEAIAVSSIAPKKFFGGQSFDNRKFQINLAFIQQISGDYANAEASFSTIEKEFAQKEKSTPEYAGVLNQFGILYIQMGKMEKVETILKASMEIYRKRYTEQNIYFAKVANDLGNFYRMSARYPEAETQLTKALSIRESLLGVNHPHYVRSLEDVAILHWKSNKIEKAYTAYKQVMEKSLGFIQNYFPPMSEAEKTNFWEINSPRFQRFYNFASEASATIPQVTIDFYNYHIATKALLLSATHRIKEGILKSNDKQLVDSYEQWQNNKEMLVKLYAYSKAKLKAQDIDLEKLERETNALEKKISERSAMFLSGFSKQSIEFSDVLQLLGEGEVAVDMLRVKAFQQDFTNDVKYVAFIIKKGMKSPALVQLDNGPQLEGRSLEYYKRAIQGRIADDLSYNHFWGKLDDQIRESKTIYFSPDGAFNNLNVNTLKRGTGEYIINSHNVVLLGNTKDLIRLKSKKSEAKMTSAFLLGFPDYESDRFASLPGTKKEIEAISKLMQASGYQITQHLQKHATEGNIKEASGQGVVHIATHGFFAPARETRDGSVFGIHTENASNNPLLRSGLILAAVNEADATQTANVASEENGVLTAYEAMNLNLTGTSLVILSACETGLGEVKSGEGVYGLQRAFQVAGAETIVMSLWKVDDDATQQLMTNFYSNWIKTGNKQTAFKEAQLQLMTKFPDPYFWGAFVMVGM